MGDEDVPDTDDVKRKNNRLETISSRFPLNRKQRIKSFALRHLCPVHEVLSGIGNSLISGQIVTLFGQGKCTFDCQSGTFKNYSSGNHVSTNSCMLKIEKLINFNMTCMWTFHTNFTLAWVFVSHSYTQINANTFINDLVLFTGIIQC